MDAPRKLAPPLLTTMLLAGCSHPAAEPSAAPATESRPVSGISSVTMRRDACFGPCPVYTVTVRADGSVAFDGEQHVAHVGKSRGTVSADDYAYLTRSITRLKFADWRDHYWSPKDGCKSLWTDNPSVDIVVTSGEGTKRVSYYYGCRGLAIASKINLLSQIVDDVAGTRAWIGERDD